MEAVGTVSGTLETVGTGTVSGALEAIGTGTVSGTLEAVGAGMVSDALEAVGAGIVLGTLEKIGTGTVSGAVSDISDEVTELFGWTEISRCHSGNLTVSSTKTLRLTIPIPSTSISQSCNFKL